MAIGDITLVELQATLTTTNTATTIANPDTNHTTQITSITLVCSGTTARTVSIYKNGSATANLLMVLDIDPSGVMGPKTINLSDPRFYLTGTQALYLKQDAGNDVNVLISAVKTQIA